MTVPLKVILQDGRVKLNQTVALPESTAQPLVIPIGYIGSVRISCRYDWSTAWGWTTRWQSRLSAGYTNADVYCKYQQSIDGGTPEIIESTSDQSVNYNLFGGSWADDTTSFQCIPLAITVTITTAPVCRFVTHTTSGGDCRFVTSGTSFVNSL